MLNFGVQYLFLYEKKQRRNELLNTELHLGKTQISGWKKLQTLSLLDSFICFSCFFGWCCDGPLDGTIFDG